MLPASLVHRAKSYRGAVNYISHELREESVLGGSCSIPEISINRYLKLLADLGWLFDGPCHACAMVRPTRESNLDPVASDEQRWRARPGQPLVSIDPS